MLLLPISLILYLIGRIIDVKGGRYIFKGLNYGMYIGSAIIFWVLIYSFVAWIIGQIFFGQFLLYTIIAIIIGIAISYVTSYLRKEAIRKKKIKDKLVVNELGALIGKAAEVDAKKGLLFINTSFGTRITYKIDRIVDISDKVIIR
jgi:predicted membrane protein